MQDRRRVQRTSVLKNAKIILRSGASVFDCTLLDLTNLGSCIALTSPGGVPDAFELTYTTESQILARDLTCILDLDGRVTSRWPLGHLGAVRLHSSTYLSFLTKQICGGFVRQLVPFKLSYSEEDITVTKLTCCDRILRRLLRNQLASSQAVNFVASYGIDFSDRKYRHVTVQARPLQYAA